MTQEPTANFYTFTNEHGTVQITYYPTAPGPIVQGQASGGPRLEYRGPEGNIDYDGNGVGGHTITVVPQSVLGQQVIVVLQPSIDAKSVNLTLLLPPINMAGEKEQGFHTVAIKTTSYGILPKEGARLTYEALHLRGTAKNIMLPMVEHQ